MAAPTHPLAGRPVAPGDLVGAAFVAREPGSATRKAADHALGAAGIAPRVGVELGTNDAVKRAASAGLGVAVLSARAVEPEFQADWLVRLDAAWFRCERPLVLLRHKDRVLSRAEDAFAALLRQA